MIFTSGSTKATQEFGEKISRNFSGGTVVCLRGGLGAGKTTLIQGIARGLGITRRVNSSTFIIARRHEKFWHIDLYRLTGLSEAKAIGIEEILGDKERVVLIEWPEKIEMLLPKKRLEINIETISENKRKITYEAIS